MKEDVPFFPKSQRNAGNTQRWGGHEWATEEVSRLCHHMCVCVCVTVVTPFSISLSVPLYIPGTRHRLHNASPPLCCRGAKQRHPASRNTATEAHEEGRVFVYVFVFDRQVDREQRGVCDHVKALDNRNQVGCVFLAMTPAWCFSERRGSRSFPQSHHRSTSKLPQVNGYVMANQSEIINAYFSGQKIWRAIFTSIHLIVCTA